METVNSETMASIVYLDNTGSPEPRSSISPQPAQNVYYYDTAAAVYIPYEMHPPPPPPPPPSSNGGDWYVNASPPPGSQQHWYSSNGADAVVSGSPGCGSYYSGAALGYPYYHHQSMYTSGEGHAAEGPVAVSGACIGSWPSWPLASAPCSIQSESPYLYTWTDNQHVQDQFLTPGSHQDLRLTGFEHTDQNVWQDKRNTTRSRKMVPTVSSEEVLVSSAQNDAVENIQGAYLWNQKGDALFSNGNDSAYITEMNGPQDGSNSFSCYDHVDLVGEKGNSENPLYSHLLMEMPEGQSATVPEPGGKMKFSKFRASSENLDADSLDKEAACHRKTYSAASFNHCSAPSYCTSKPFGSASVVSNKNVQLQSKWCITENNNAESSECKDFISACRDFNCLNLKDPTASQAADCDKSYPVDILSSNFYPSKSKDPLLFSEREDAPVDAEEPGMKDCSNFLWSPSSLVQDGKYSTKPVTCSDSDQLLSDEKTEKTTLAGLFKPEKSLRNSRNSIVKAMHNLSLTLLAGSSQLQEDIEDRDLQTVNAVICNLSEYLVNRMENFTSATAATQKVYSCSCLVKCLYHTGEINPPASMLDATKDRDFRSSKSKSLLSHSSPKYGESAAGKACFGTNKESVQSPTSEWNGVESPEQISRRLLENLKEGFKSELAEKYKKINLYRTLLSKAEEEMDLLKYENRLAQMELEMNIQEKHRCCTLADGVSDDKGFTIPDNCEEPGFVENRNGSDHRTAVPGRLKKIKDSSLDSYAYEAIQGHEDVPFLDGGSQEIADETISHEDIGLTITGKELRNIESSLIDAPMEQLEFSDSATIYMDRKNQQNNLDSGELNTALFVIPTEMSCDKKQESTDIIRYGADLVKKPLWYSRVSKIEDLNHGSLLYSQDEPVKVLSSKSESCNDLMEHYTPKCNVISGFDSSPRNKVTDISAFYKDNVNHETNMKNYPTSWQAVQSPSVQSTISAKSSLWEVKRGEETKHMFQPSSYGSSFSIEGTYDQPNSVSDTFAVEGHSVESNSLTENWDQAILNLLDEGPRVENQSEYKFVSCQSHFENGSSKSEVDSFCSDSESGWEEVDGEYQLFP